MQCVWGQDTMQKFDVRTDKDWTAQCTMSTMVSWRTLQRNAAGWH